ncbi:hypothetical protein NHQ30_007556 [Ciborinia camelliae]|nr:hypothetical protein NHQ30_007556 [Ciborinia camelliae]
MAPFQVERIEANCKIIWGDHDYAFDVDDENDGWYCTIRRDYGDGFGKSLVVTGLFNTEKKAWIDLDRMLRKRAKQIQSGKPMAKDQIWETLGKPHTRDRDSSEDYMDGDEEEEDGEEEDWEDEDGEEEDGEDEDGEEEGGEEGDREEMDAEERGDKKTETQV